MTPILGNIVALLSVEFGQTKTWDAVNDTTAEQTVTVPGLKVGDKILGISKPTHQAGCTIGTARVSAANTLAMTIITTANVTPTASETYTALVLREEGKRTDAVA